jgi:hypothetical protein
MVATAVPTITASFNASEVDYAWIGTAYLLPAAGRAIVWNPFRGHSLIHL